MSLVVSFLGTNGWYDSDMGNTICVLVRGGEETLIFDAGNGLSKVGCQIPAPLPVGHLFLSHFHLDHVVGLHTLALLGSLRKLVIAGPEGTRLVLGTLLAAPFTVPLARLPYEVELRELPAECGALPFPVQALPLRHGSTCIGFRVTLGGRIVSYCPDTGYCDNAVLLARDADLLITECAYRSGETNDRWPHLNPETAARIAREAGAKRLALTHFDASRYRTPADRKDAELAARRIFPDCVAATDGLQLTVD